ncbi:hypothetical protein HELRODRAFT_90848 [Helobdella robusta]|uniref:NADP-dependent oxidoreductase domain-containing protein n=1 Tax=Helobdella robusta TaxID=6412 RepID=T1G7W9_HELRO|nr:hypothetical protein HELRODRAFT_90848 [Helobdella robusta]ESN90241.1 hypothetical protein HELRODRAFT_90848 [Helobdella robusta]
MYCYKNLSSGHKMPAFGLGTWQSKLNEVGEAVVSAIRAGYRMIDCAFIYGNEEEIGCAIKHCIDDLQLVSREELFITSKLWNTKHRPDDVQPALRESLKRLKLNYLDLYLIHWPIAFKSGEEVFPTDSNGNLIYEDVDFKETWRAMECCVKSGLLRSIGLSNFNSQQITEILSIATVKPANLQVEIHPYLQQTKLVEFCHRNQMTVTSYSSFASPRRPWLDEETKNSVNLFNEPVLLKIAANHGKTVAQVILRWLFERDIIVIPKSVNPSRIKENLQIDDFRLTEEDLGQIKCLNRNQRVILPMIVNKEGKKVPRDISAPNYPFNVEF